MSEFLTAHPSGGLFLSLAPQLTPVRLKKIDYRQILLTGYELKIWSELMVFIFSVIACAIIIRSNGSLWKPSNVDKVIK
ncbi:hypothetical protein FACS189430_12550 [Bacteroidia bacterium]|nr:hypothetical protein FACS189430_12550 [Bacteroidia bacterium]